MDDLYPPESQKMDVIAHLEELRKRILTSLLFLVIAGIFAFSQGESLMRIIKKPAEGLIERLIFITPSEGFVSYVKVSLLAGLILSFPAILYQAWAFLAPAVDKRKRPHIVFWIVLAFAGFLAGIIFSYWVAIPAALRFLIHFGEGIAVPAITLSKYVSFFGAFTLIGGLVFEIPIIIGLLTDIGIVRSKVLCQHRRYAILLIFVAAAIITPTQDIINMLVFAVPMMALFEAGILIAKVIERRNKETK